MLINGGRVVAQVDQALAYAFEYKGHGEGAVEIVNETDYNCCVVEAVAEGTTVKATVGDKTYAVGKFLRWNKGDVLTIAGVNGAYFVEAVPVELA